MYIQRITILNYKSCQNVALEVHKDIPNTFIGINDCGKSAILKAIGLLLDPKMAFNIRSDARPTADISNTIIDTLEIQRIFAEYGALPFNEVIDGTVVIAQFKIEEDEIDQDFKETASNQFKWAIDSNSNNTFSILKYYSPTDAVGKYYLLVGESSPPKSLWSKKAAELTALKKELSLTDEEIKNENGIGRFANLEIIKAAYKKLGTSMAWAEAPTFLKTDLPLLPKYRYIDWNTSLLDIENMANDVLKSKIEASRQTLAVEAARVSETATDEVNKEFEELTQQLTKDLSNITSIKAKVNFAVTEKISDIIINKGTADGDIRLDSQGEGVKRQLLFAFLKWANARNLPEGTGIKKFIWCFDEPESHLYPTAQRDLFNTITGLASKNYQIFLGTHSTIFVDRTRLNDIFRVTLNSKYSEILKCTTIEDVHDILGVRNSDILFFDKFIAVEGESENILIPYFFKLYKGFSLEESSIKLIPLGGISKYQANKLIFENIIREFKKVESVVYYIFDADTKESGTNVHLLGTCDLEDLIPNTIWIQLIQAECGVTITEEQLTTIRSTLDPNVASSKLHAKLAKHVATEVTSSGTLKYLPSKTKCAELIKSYIIQKEDIPQQILDAFLAILSS